MRQLSSNKEFLLLSYKLAVDLLFLLLVFLGAALIAEALLPGIVSDHFSLLRIIILVSADILLIFAIGSLAGVRLKSLPIGKKTAAGLSLLFLLLVFNSILKLNIFLAVFILILAALAGYLVYLNLFEK